MNFDGLLLMTVIMLITYLYLLHVSEKFYVKSVKFWGNLYKKIKEKRNNSSEKDKKEEDFWDTFYTKMKERFQREENENE